mmetsp:Transcript_29554/g.70212  ORF Transcript_29554/g.70212 Transcript_29554/m.70212 type:complete len:226 (+) Transcript_29554:2005-2682(+)
MVCVEPSGPSRVVLAPFRPSSGGRRALRGRRGRRAGRSALLHPVDEVERHAVVDGHAVKGRASSEGVSGPSHSVVFQDRPVGTGVSVEGRLIADRVSGGVVHNLHKGVCGAAVVTDPGHHTIERRHELELRDSAEDRARPAPVRDQTVLDPHDVEHGHPRPVRGGLVVVQHTRAAPGGRGQQLRDLRDDARYREIVARVRGQAVRQGGAVAVTDQVHISVRPQDP